MRRLLAGLAVAALVAGGAGCAKRQTTYNWGDYDEALHDLYRNPGRHQEYVAALKEVILANQRDGTKIPPGIYAEYGYALYEEGNAAEAIRYYRLEIQAWPASRVFMEKMIVAAERQPRPGSPSAPPTGPATSLEKATGS